MVSNILEEEQELAKDTKRQCSPGCRHSLCKSPRARRVSFQRPEPGSAIYKGVFLSPGRSTVNGTAARPERCTEHASPASRFEREAWKYEPKTLGVQGYFCKWHHLRGYPGADGRHLPPSLLSHSHGRSPWYMQCAHAPVCGHVCDLTLSVSHPPPGHATRSFPSTGCPSQG